MLTPLLTTNFLNQCLSNISYLNQNNWLGITSLVVIAVLLIAAIVYGVGGLFPPSTYERLKGVVKYEYIQGIFSIMLIMLIFGMSLTSCTMAGLLTQTATATPTGSTQLGITSTTSQCGASYQDPYQFANCYIGNLMFSKGTTLVTGMISAGTLFYIDGTLVTYIISFIGTFIPSINLPGSVGPVSGSLSVTPTISSSDEPAEVLFDYSSVLSAVLEPVIVVTFGLLFMLFLSLNIIEFIALTIIVPVAIIMRSLAFTGPRLREAANAFIAIGLAFYFILPLTIAMNYYIVNWTYCNNPGVCNPYASSYLNPGYKLNTLPVSKLFTDPESNTIAGFPSLSIPYNFYGYYIPSGNGGFGGSLTTVATGLISVPNVLNNYVTETAEYMFEGIFLLALDVAITVGFALGFQKGLDSLGQIIQVGPFWGS